MNMSNQDNKQKLSEEQKQTLKKYAVFAAMGITCLICIWFIFKPSASDKAKKEQQSGFNTEIPDPKNEGIIGDKRDAYEHEQIQQRQAERMRSLSDFNTLLGDGSTLVSERSRTTLTNQSDSDLGLLTDETPTQRTGGMYQTATNPTPVQHSMNAYHDINRTLGSFYETPRYDPEKERLERELDELRQRLDEQENERNAVDTQMALMERSFQMASRYMPMGMTDNATPNSEVEVQPSNTNVSGKTVVVPILQVREQTVSALPQQMEIEDFIDAFSQPRNMDFLTATKPTLTMPKNTISAVIYADQTVIDGNNVRLRLTEPMRAGDMLIPQNSLLSGVARIQGERLQIVIFSIEHRGTIIPVEISIFDTDGQRGIFIPNIMELNAAKEIVASMGTNAGTSVNISTDAGEQFVADMGRSAIQGVSQFFSRKMREVKVNLKAGYKVLLLPNDR
jgi:conjugative transposon TraM protein